MTPPGAPLLELAGVDKAFGPVQAVEGVDLDVRAGEIHALIGENGAGKSTLVKMIAGLLRPDRGEIRVDGRAVELTSRRRSAEAGIGVVHQHFSLVPSFTAAENLMLGRPGAGRRLRLRAAAEELRAWGERTGLAVDPDVPVGRLSVGERQRVEVLTALAWGARVLLLDEPTATLSPDEADRLLAVLRTLADGPARGPAGEPAGGPGEGPPPTSPAETPPLGVLLVTHKLREVELAADRVTVLRAGRVTGRHARGDVARQRLVAEMVGEAPAPTPRTGGPAGEVRVALRDAAAGRLRRVSLDVRAGEVLGVAGVAGNGQTDLVGLLAGRTAPESGEVAHPVGGPGSVAYIPEDRARDALAAELPVWVNAVATRTHEIGSWRGLDRDRVAAITRRAIELLGVRPAAPDATAAHLSGGNQQRLVIGRELQLDPGLVVAAEPTRGLDPASARDVVDALGRAAAGGAAVVVVSSDLDELLLIADRLVVLFEGRIVADLPRAAATRDAVAAAMVGHRDDDGDRTPDLPAAVGAAP
ncbi:MAG TPA: ATP-binding cassette domain-containing protein [Acidimicrobiales bacterium]